MDITRGTVHKGQLLYDNQRKSKVSCYGTPRNEAAELHSKGENANVFIR